MEAISLAAILKILSDFGIVGLVIFMWWSDNKRIWKVIDQHKADITVILATYQHDMTEQREMYKTNISLCRDFSTIATDLRDIITLNIQSMTHLDDAIRTNQFCPVMRVKLIKTLGKIPGEEG